MSLKLNYTVSILKKYKISLEEVLPFMLIEKIIMGYFNIKF